MPPPLPPQQNSENIANLQRLHRTQMMLLKQAQDREMSQMTVPIRTWKAGAGQQGQQGGQLRLGFSAPPAAGESGNLDSDLGGVEIHTQPYPSLPLKPSQKQDSQQSFRGGSESGANSEVTSPVVEDEDSIMEDVEDENVLHGEEKDERNGQRQTPKPQSQLVTSQSSAAPSGPSASSDEVMMMLMTMMQKAPGLSSPDVGAAGGSPFPSLQAQSHQGNQNSSTNPSAVRDTTGTRSNRNSGSSRHFESMLDGSGTGWDNPVAEYQRWQTGGLDEFVAGSPPPPSSSSASQSGVATVDRNMSRSRVPSSQQELGRPPLNPTTSRKGKKSHLIDLSSTPSEDIMMQLNDTSDESSNRGDSDRDLAGNGGEGNGSSGSGGDGSGERGSSGSGSGNYNHRRHLQHHHVRTESESGTPPSQSELIGESSGSGGEGDGTVSSGGGPGSRDGEEKKGSSSNLEGKAKSGIKTDMETESEYKASDICNSFVLPFSLKLCSSLSLAGLWLTLLNDAKQKFQAKSEHMKQRNQFGTATPQTPVTSQTLNNSHQTSNHSSTTFNHGISGLFTDNDTGMYDFGFYGLGASETSIGDDMAGGFMFGGMRGNAGSNSEPSHNDGKRQSSLEPGLGSYGSGQQPQPQLSNLDRAQLEHHQQYFAQQNLQPENAMKRAQDVLLHRRQAQQQQQATAQASQKLQQQQQQRASSESAAECERKQLIESQRKRIDDVDSWTVDPFVFSEDDDMADISQETTMPQPFGYLDMNNVPSYLDPTTPIVSPEFSSQMVYPPPHPGQDSEQNPLAPRMSQQQQQQQQQQQGDSANQTSAAAAEAAQIVTLEELAKKVQESAAEVMATVHALRRDRAARLTPGASGASDAGVSLASPVTGSFSDFGQGAGQGFSQTGSQTPQPPMFGNLRMISGDTGGLNMKVKSPSPAPQFQQFQEQPPPTPPPKSQQQPPLTHPQPSTLTSQLQQQPQQHQRQGIAVTNHFTANPSAFSRLIPHLDDLLLALGKDTTILYASPSAIHFLGDPGELVGKQLKDLIHTDDANALETAVENGFKEGTGFTIYVRVKDPPEVSSLALKGDDAEGFGGLGSPVLNDDEHRDSRIGSRRSSFSADVGGVSGAGSEQHQKPSGRCDILELLGRPVVDVQTGMVVYMLEVGRSYQTKGNLSSDHAWSMRLENARLRSLLEEELRSRGVDPKSHPLLDSPTTPELLLRDELPQGWEQEVVAHVTESSSSNLPFGVYGEPNEQRRKSSVDVNNSLSNPAMFGKGDAAKRTFSNLPGGLESSIQSVKEMKGPPSMGMGEASSKLPPRVNTSVANQTTGSTLTSSPGSVMGGRPLMSPSSSNVISPPSAGGPAPATQLSATGNVIAPRKIGSGSSMRPPPPAMTPVPLAFPPGATKMALNPGRSDRSGGIGTHKIASTTVGSNAAKPPRKKKVKVPTDDLFCRRCGTTTSPEWRKGPDGPKTLCNACGLAHSKKQRKDSLRLQAATVAAGPSGPPPPHPLDPNLMVSSSQVSMMPRQGPIPNMPMGPPPMMGLGRGVPQVGPPLQQQPRMGPGINPQLQHPMIQRAILPHPPPPAGPQNPWPQ
ncbi:blue light receptor [Phlyctochytrium planicorne]|nr:blue light receptor [Phlyctochytrium planicorne]